MSLLDLIQALKSSNRDKYEFYEKITKIMFVLTGLWKSPVEREVNYKIVAAIVTNMTITCICLLFALYHSMDTVDLEEMSEGLMFFILFSRIMLSYLWMVKRLPSMNRLIDAKERNYDDFENKSILLGKTGLSELKIKCDNWNFLFFKSLVCLFINLLSLYTFSTGFYLPYSPVKNHIIPFQTPWDLKKYGNLYYYLAFSNQFMTSALGITLGTLDVSFSVMSINMLCLQTDILGEVWKQTRSYSQLRLNVQQHVLLLSLMNDMQAILSFIVLDMFLTCEFMLCLCSFQIYQIYSTTTFVSLIKNICMLAALIVHEFVYFFFGQRLVTKTQDLQRSLYFCEWYKESKSFKSSMNIIQSRMNKPFTILAGKIIPVTLASFITCLKAAFSYFNLLRALTHT